MAARRTSGAGRPAALATASTMIPSSAPWRSSPVSSRTRKSFSSVVAPANSVRSRALRDAAEPFPPVEARRASVASTSRIWRLDVSEEAVRAAWSVAQPTPSFAWRALPERYAITISISSGAACRRSAARSSIFARREDVSVTSRDVRTSCWRIIGPRAGAAGVLGAHLARDGVPRECRRRAAVALVPGDLVVPPRVWEADTDWRRAARRYTRVETKEVPHANHCPPDAVARTRFRRPVGRCRPGFAGPCRRSLCLRALPGKSRGGSRPESLVQPEGVHGEESLSRVARPVALRLEQRHPRHGVLHALTSGTSRDRGRW